MNRLTRRSGKCVCVTKEEFENCQKYHSKSELLTSAFCSFALKCPAVEQRTCVVLKTMDTLAEYEDTELTPSEILALKAECERLKDTNKALENDNYNLDMNLTHLSEELDELKSKTIK